MYHSLKTYCVSTFVKDRKIDFPPILQINKVNITSKNLFGCDDDE